MKQFLNTILKKKKQFLPQFWFIHWKWENNAKKAICTLNHTISNASIFERKNEYTPMKQNLNPKKIQPLMMLQERKMPFNQ